MSISFYSKQNLKTSQLMNQIYRRIIAAQLEQKQIVSYLFANDRDDQFDRNEIFINDIYKLLQNIP